MLVNTLSNVNKWGLIL